MPMPVSLFSTPLTKMDSFCPNEAYGSAAGSRHGGGHTVWARFIAQAFVTLPTNCHLDGFR